VVLGIAVRLGVFKLVYQHLLVTSVDFEANIHT